MACVTFQLTGSTDFWWEAQKKIMTPEQFEQLTWEDFKAEVYEQYIPRSYRKEKEMEFYSLQQGHMTVTEYDRTFCALSRYAPEQVDTNEKRAEKFRAGLKQEIKTALASRGRLMYRESLSLALDIEATLPKKRSTTPTTPTPPLQQQPVREKRKWDEGQTPYGNMMQQSNRNPPQNGERQLVPHQKGEYRPMAPLCVRCSRNHFGKCKAGTDGCYNCGKSGHISRECRNKNVGMEARQNYRGPHPQLKALQAKPRGDPTI